MHLCLFAVFFDISIRVVCIFILMAISLRIKYECLA